jgi:hypothetical protein
MGMLITSIDMQMFHATATKRTTWDHTLNSFDQNTLWKTAIKQFFSRT